MFPESDLPQETALALLGNSWARAMGTGTGISDGWWWKHPLQVMKIPLQTARVLSHCVILQRPQALPGTASFASLSLWDGCSTLPEPSRPSQLPNRQLQRQFLCFYFWDSRNWKKVELDENRSLLDVSCEFIRSGDSGKANQENKHAQLWKSF